MINDPYKLIVILLIFLLLEIILFLISYGRYCSKAPNFRKEGTIEDIKLYSLKTLSWLAVVLALMVLNKESLNILVFLVVSLVLFVLSFRFEVISGTKRIFFIIQQRTFNYAIIFLYIALFLFVIGLFEELKWIMMIIGIIILFIHIHEIIGDLEIAHNTK